MIRVQQCGDLDGLERFLNEIRHCEIVATHVGVDENGWWSVVIYRGDS